MLSHTVLECTRTSTHSGVYLLTSTTNITSPLFSPHTYSFPICISLLINVLQEFTNKLREMMDRRDRENRERKEQDKAKQSARRGSVFSRILARGARVTFAPKPRKNPSTPGGMNGTSGSTGTDRGHDAAKSGRSVVTPIDDDSNDKSAPPPTEKSIRDSNNRETLIRNIGSEDEDDESLPGHQDTTHTSTTGMSHDVPHSLHVQSMGSMGSSTDSLFSSAPPSEDACLDYGSTDLDQDSERVNTFEQKRRDHEAGSAQHRGQRKEPPPVGHHAGSEYNHRNRGFNW